MCGRGGQRTLKVESMGPGEVKEPGLLLRPSPTPPTTQAKTMGACAQPPGCRGQGQAPAGSSPAVPATTPPQDHACQAAHFF